jgi:hypothetical protein
VLYRSLFWTIRRKSAWRTRDVSAQFEKARRQGCFMLSRKMGA